MPAFAQWGPFLSPIPDTKHELQPDSQPSLCITPLGTISLPFALSLWWPLPWPSAGFSIFLLSLSDL